MGAPRPRSPADIAAVVRKTAAPALGYRYPYGRVVLVSRAGTVTVPSGPGHESALSDRCAIVRRARDGDP
ncbi:hypothetical protein NONO_c54960 [Nocardia nova SH22a]|uniref:Uncharacterized protein n=1 Tax=Nocardia nova SH22a TaxID=1415166 RepID=W5TSR7_9NOCA|nr:hypothetical protein NONO_c54960 [Nocardia nova SH22a]